MRGICGELRLDDVSPDVRADERMAEQLVRRVPEHAGTFADAPLAFSHRRLAIIDLSPSADQPMVDTTLLLALMSNGTIYNYREQRTELVAMGYTSLSKGSSEVMLKAYHAWGEPCVQRVCGMFVFAIWDIREVHDKQRASLLFARDRFGIKPHYVAKGGERLHLASSLPAPLPGGGKYPLNAIARSVTPDAVIDRPNGYFPVPALKPLKHLHGRFLKLMRGILMSDACTQRGFYQRAHVEKLLANPEAHSTRIRGGKPWHLALLESWLQVHVGGVPCGSRASSA